MKDKLIMLTHKQFKQLRRKQYIKQGGKCAILGKKVNINDCVFDHKHKLKSEPLGGPEGLGCLRGVVQNNVNVFEGKLWKLWKRFGLSKTIDLPTLLRKCANYIENPPIDLIYVHPNERPKRKKLKLPDYYRICKYWFVLFPKRRVLPKYPKNGIKTIKWKELQVLADMEHKRVTTGYYTRYEIASIKKQIAKAQGLTKAIKENRKK